MADLKSTLLGLGKSAVKTSGNLVNTAKLTLTLSNEETKLNAMYTEMGKKVAEIYSYGATIGDYFTEKYVEVVAAQERIAQIKSDIETAKGIRTCKKCGKSAPIAAEFCPKCGDALGSNQPEVVAMETPQHQFHPQQGFDMRLDEPINMNEPEPEPELEPPSPPPSIDIKVCGVCGSRNDAYDKFCLSCGRAI